MSADWTTVSPATPTRTTFGLSACRMLAAAAKFSLPSGLLTVLAAVLAVRTTLGDHTLAAGVSALVRVGHGCPPWRRLYAPAKPNTSTTGTKMVVSAFPSATARDKIWVVVRSTESPLDGPRPRTQCNRKGRAHRRRHCRRLTQTPMASVMLTAEGHNGPGSDRPSEMYEIEG